MFKHLRPKQLAAINDPYLNSAEQSPNILLIAKITFSGLSEGLTADFIINSI
jgi:hypothetical protein